MNRHGLEWALYCATEVLNTRRLRGQPIPQELRDYHEELDAAWAEMSAAGPKTCAAASAHPTIGVMDVAAMLHRTPRHVRRIAPSIGGQRVNGTWIFQRAAVEKYARRKASA